MEVMRPEATAGPRERRRSPWKVEEFQGESWAERKPAAKSKAIDERT
jgi:hypothetical protein